MKAPKKHIDSFLRQKLAGTKVPVDDSEWEMLLTRLPAKKYKKKGLLFFFSSVVLLLTIGSLYHLYNQDTAITELVKPGVEHQNPVKEADTASAKSDSEQADKGLKSQTVTPTIPNPVTPGPGISLQTSSPSLSPSVQVESSLPNRETPLTKDPVTRNEESVVLKGSLAVFDTLVKQVPEIPGVADTTAKELVIETKPDTSSAGEESKENNPDRVPVDDRQPVKAPLGLLPAKRYFYLEARVEVFNARNRYEIIPEEPNDTLQGTLRHKNYEKNMQPAGGPQPSFNLRFLLGMATPSNISFNTGIVYNRTVQAYNFDFKRNELPFFDANGRIFHYFIVADSLNPEKVHTTVENTVSQLIVPFQAGYSITMGKKITLGVQVGGSAGFNFAGKFTALNTGTLVIESQENATRPFNLGMQGGIQLGYALPKNWVVKFGVEYQRQVTELYKPGIEIHILPYHYGFNLSIRKIFYHEKENYTRRMDVVADLIPPIGHLTSVATSYQPARK